MTEYERASVVSVWADVVASDNAALVFAIEVLKRSVKDLRREVRSRAKERLRSYGRK